MFQLKWYRTIMMWMYLQTVLANNQGIKRG